MRRRRRRARCGSCRVRVTESERAASAGGITPVALVTAAVFAVGFAVLMAGLAPAGSWRDVTEFQWAAATLGVPHPPGTPLQMLLARFSTLLPIGSIGWRVNLLSCLAGAGGLALAYLLAIQLMELAWPRAPRLAITILGLAAPMALLGSPVYREHAATAEVYALQALGAAAVAWLLIRQACHPGTRDVRPLATVVLLTALGTGVHVSFAFYLAGILLWFAVRERDWLGPRALALLASLVVLGGAVFVYVPLRASTGPSIDWGDAVTLDRLAYHLSDEKDREHHDDAATPEHVMGAGQPGHAAQAGPTLVESAVNRARASVASTVQWTRFIHEYMTGELGVLGEALAILGLVLVCARHGGAGGAIAMLVAAHLAFAIPIGKWANPTGYNPMYLLGAALACVPWAALLAIGPVSRSAPLASLVVVAALAAPAARFAASPPVAEQAQDFRSDELAREMVRPLAPNSILLAAHLWPIFGYLREVEGYRTDVDVVFRNEIYETQRMRVDPRRVHDLVLPPPRRLETRSDRIARMAAFLELNHRRGRPIAWQSEVDDLFFAVRPTGLLFEYQGDVTDASQLAPAPGAPRALDAWARSFEPGGPRHAWLRDDDDFEEAVLPIARYAGWRAARLA